MDKTESHSLRFCDVTNEKDPALESVFGATFSDYGKQNIALRRHSMAILQSIFCYLLVTALS